METTRFEFITRAQINTSNSKPCTYFAYDRQNDRKRVFVKGPYKTKESVEIASKVLEFKTFITGKEPLGVEIVEMEVGDLENCQLGSRLSMIGKMAWFQVWDDLLYSLETLPVKMKESKAWKIPVSVVDWDKIGLFSHVTIEKDYRQSIYTQDVQAAFELVFHIILSWVCGCGGDLALRNFVYNKSDRKIHQVDLENWCNGGWELSNTRICSSRSVSGEFFSRFVREHPSEIELFIKTLYDKKTGIQDRWKPLEAKFICDRIDALYNNAESVLVIQDSRGTKRRLTNVEKSSKKKK